MDSEKNIEAAEYIVRNDAVDVRSNSHVAQAAGVVACAYALIAIAKELQSIRQTMEKTEARAEVDNGFEWIWE